MGYGHWQWRAIPAAIGVAAYPFLAPTDWRNPYLLLYDVPTLGVACGFAGAAVQAMLAGAARQGAPRLALLAVATVFAWGARYRDWPFSGHLTIALTAGIQEAGDRGNPAWLRTGALLPALLLVFIRTFRPQSSLMSSRMNTLTALLLGAMLGLLGLVVARHGGHRKE